MSYVVLKNRAFTIGQYRIIPIREEDKFEIMEWRNTQLDILRQSELLTREKQEAYFQNVVKKDFDKETPSQILFSYLLNDELIGYGGVVHLNWTDRRGEISFLLETKRNQDVAQFKTDYSAYLKLIKQVAFSELNLNKVTTEAFDLRPYLIETLEANGFVQEGRLKRQNFIGGRFVDSLLHACFNSQV